MAETTTPPIPDLEDLQHWTWGLGRAQEIMVEHGFDWVEHMPAAPAFGAPAFPAMLDPSAAIRATTDFWSDTMKLWQRFLDPTPAEPFGGPPEQARDRRFKAPQWREEPVFDFLRQSYLVIAD